MFLGCKHLIARDTVSFSQNASFPVVIVEESGNIVFKNIK